MTMRERVSVVRCETTADDAEVMQRTLEAIRGLGDYGSGFRSTRKIAVKINAGVPRYVLTDGKQTEVTEPAVIEAAIHAIREVTDAEIVVGDAATSGGGPAIYEHLGLPKRLARYPDVRLVDFGEGELAEVAKRDPDAMFARYTLHRELAEADAFVSLSKMKAHRSMGCTLCIKNLFGWTPPRVYGSPRRYLHDKLIRLPHVLADLAGMMRPCLNVIDGIVAANLSEWHGVALKPGVIVAGTNVVATDHVGARLMGYDPQADYPVHPFLYRRNAILLAAERGIGPNSQGDIEVVGASPEQAAVPFHVEKYGQWDRDAELRRGADTVDRYVDQRDSLAVRYRGRILALRDGAVLWHGSDMVDMLRLERESGLDWRSGPEILVRCRPAEDETENFDIYRSDLRAMESASLAPCA